MAKTESTAVNELIDLVQRKQPTPPPAGDLFSMNPPRMSASTVPSMKAAGDIEPLPRNRAPQATRDQPVRMRAASPPRGTTIPPLPRRSAPSGTMAPPASMRAPAATMAPPAGLRAPATRPSVPPLPPPMRASAPAGTLPPPTRASAPAGTLPPPMRASAPVPSLPPLQPMHAPSPFQAPLAPSAPPAPIVQPLFPTLASPDVASDHWYEQQRPTLLTGIRPREQSDTLALVKKLIAPGLLVIAAGIVIGAVIATGRKSTTHAHPTPAAATPARPTSPTLGDEEHVLRPSLPRGESENAATVTAGGGDAQPPTKAEQAAQIKAAAAMSGTLTQEAPKAAVAALDERGPGAVHEVKTPKGVVKLVDVRIDSTPSGATVTLVDAGVQSFLGTTPLSTSVDLARNYDVIVALDGRPTQMVHLDPTATSRLDVSLGTSHHAAVPAAAPAPAPHAAVTHAHVAKAVPATNLEAPSEPAPKSESTSAIADPFGDTDAKGTLMVSSKPPCDIVIDGAATGLQTPQRSIELAPGTHEVTFVNDAEGIKKTVTVTIKSGKPTKLIQDLMKQ